MSARRLDLRAIILLPCDCYTNNPVPGKKKRIHMADPDSPPPSTSESWDTYWRDAEYDAAYTSGGIGHPLIQSFWKDYFQAVQAAYDAPKIIDIASGNGAVIECAASSFRGRPPDLTCLDISASAIEMLEQRFPSVQTVIADANEIPLDSAGFDIATSQFGIEYGGLGAIIEVARLIAPGGQLAFLMHNQGGSIYRECTASLDAIERMQQAEFIPSAIAMFEKGFAACRGADRAEYEAAAERLAPAVRTLESILTQYGKHVAGDVVMRLYDDVGTIHERIQHYEPSEVLDWLDKLEDQLQAFAERMTSMRDAAIDSATFRQICERLREQGFTTLRAEALVEPGQSLPLAWVLIAAQGRAETMSDDLDGDASEEIDAWIKENFDESVQELMRRGIVTATLIEARPVWSLPFEFVIGQVRDADDISTFKWVISGAIPVDHVDSTIASTPREAARHFALKWQLDAARYKDSSTQESPGTEQKQNRNQHGEELATRAEALFELVETESLWQQNGDF